jgi:hypothetical protein
MAWAWPLRPDMLLSAWDERFGATMEQGMRHTGSCLLAALAVLGVPGLSDAQNGQATPQLVLLLELGKSTLRVGEPVYATVRLINNGSTPFKVHRNIALHGGAVELEIAPDGGTPTFFQPLSETFTLAPPLELAPRMETSATSPIFYGAKGWTLTKYPGTYILRARYSPPGRKPGVMILSDPMTVVVMPGDGAGEYLMDGPAATEAGKFLLWLGGDHLKAGIGRLYGLLERYPASPLADYVNLALGRSANREFNDYSRKAIRPPDYRKALEHFGKIRRENLPPYLQIMWLAERVRALVGTGDFQQGHQLIEEATALIDNQPKWKQFLAQLREIKAGQ